VDVILASLLNSYPRIGDRPAEQVLRRALHGVDRGELQPSDVAGAEDEMTCMALRDQSDAGMDLLGDGQIRWHDPVSHVARGLAGFRIEGLLRYFDTNTYYRQPAAIGPIGRERPFLVEAYRFAAAAAAPRPVKGIVTGPITLARLSRDARGRGMRDLALEIASALNRELLDLEAAGAAMIQIDEPVLARFPGDVDLLRLAMRRLVAGLSSARVILATSFGDATPCSDGLVSLPVAMLGFDVVAALERTKVAGAAPEDTPVAAAGLGARLAAALVPGTGLLLGVLDGRNTRLEDPDETYERRVRPILEALRTSQRPASEVHLAPNHGLEFLPRDTARAKLSRLAALRDRARQEFA
jgi:5-methyltetrahydropteroyltriglutamate--homocysteine methyltransferase